jgi:hypothetical protein
MSTQETTDSLKRTARIAGALTLLMAVIAPFGMIYVPSTLVVPGDATATANNILASEGLLRLGIAANAIVFLIEIVLVVMLYVLLKPVSKTFSLAVASTGGQREGCGLFAVKNRPGRRDDRVGCGSARHSDRSR